MYNMKTIKGLILAGMIGLTGLLAGCGGGGAGGTAVVTTSGTSLSGTAATGAAMAGATITVKDSTGLTVGTTTAAANGTFTLTVATPANYAGPFMLQADPTPAAIASGDEHYSFLRSLDAVTAANNHVNITAVTSLILFEATKINLATLFGTPAVYSALTDDELIQARSNVVAKFPGLAGLANQDFFGQTFSANGTDVYDAAMDAIDLVKIQFSGDTPTLRNSANGVIAYDVTTPLYPIDSISVVAGSAQQVADSASYNLISATVTNSQGSPAKGVSVNFSSSAGTLYNSAKTAVSSTATTDATGVAKIYLKSGSYTGNVTVRAESSDNAASSLTTVTFIAGAPAAVGLSASPSSVIPGAATTLTAVVTDANGNLVADGENIVFTVSSTSGGALGGTFGGAPVANRTTSNGYVTLQYTAGNVAGSETIKATTTNGSNRSLALTVSAAAPPITSVTLASASSSLIANGASTTTLTATARDSGGNGVPGATISFSASAGSLNAASAVTNASGVATVTLTAGTQILTAITSASVNGITATQNINFTAGTAAAIGINAAPNAVKPGGTSTLTVAVVDANGNAIANEPVSLSISTKNSGTPSLSSLTGTTNANGLLSVTYTAGANNGTDTVRAITSNGLANTTTINVSGNNAVVGSVSMVALAPSIPVGVGTTTIRATVRDSANQAIPGISVSFGTSAGSIGGVTTVTTDANGVAQVTLTAGNQVLVAKIEATANGVANSVNVNFTAGTPSTVTLSAAPSTVNPGVGSTIYAYVVDANLNPVVGETVTFSIPTKGSGLPTLAVTTAVTNANGLATVTYTAGASNGTDTVSVLTSNGKNDTLNITVNTAATVVGSITLKTGAATLPADGVSTTTLRATVLSSSGAPVSGVTVNFMTSGGSLGANSATTNASGIAETTLTSPIRTGSVQVTAEASGFLDSQSVTIVAGQPAGAKFVLSASPASVSAGGSSALTAIVLDANDNPVAGQTVTFTITTNNTHAAVTPATATTSANGIATASYTGGNVVGVDTVRAALVSGLSTTTTITVSGNALNALSIGTSRTTVKSDGSETATITVTALSSQNVVVPGITVSFAADGGQLSVSQAVTNASGQAQVNLSAGSLDKSNRVVSVTASATGVTSVQLPVQVVGSTVALVASSTTLTAGAAAATITVTARDASGLGIFNVPVTLTQSGAGSLNIAATSGNTDASGQFTTTATGLTAGNVALTATALAATSTQTLAVLPGSTFGITAPVNDPESMSTGGTLVFTVNAPTQSSVRLGTTIGTWSVCPGGVAGTSVCTTTVAAGSATATLTAANTGIANIQVDGLNGSGAVTGSDTHTVAVTATTTASVSLQASAANVKPSSGGTLNTVSLIATVRDALGQPVGKIPVAFTLLNTTSGGETISPVIKLSSDGVASTDPLGQARTTFTSGSLPSGQTNASVQIVATAVGSGVTSTPVNIVIGGTAGSVVVGGGTVISSSTPSTEYYYPMSVLVADSNGNPVPAGTVVSLSVWPKTYSLGGWTEVGGKCSISITSTLANEDANENLILDAGEDANGDSQLTPLNSSAGTLPSSVVTDANGVANFNLVYPKSYAGWITVRMRASTLVQGTETTSVLYLSLPWAKADSEACLLGPSPFNP